MIMHNGYSRQSVSTGLKEHVKALTILTVLLCIT